MWDAVRGLLWLGERFESEMGWFTVICLRRQRGGVSEAAPPSQRARGGCPGRWVPLRSACRADNKKGSHGPFAFIGDVTSALSLLTLSFATLTSSASARLVEKEDVSRGRCYWSTGAPRQPRGGYVHHTKPARAEGGRERMMSPQPRGSAPRSSIANRSLQTQPDDIIPSVIRAPITSCHQPPPLRQPSPIIQQATTMR